MTFKTIKELEAEKERACLLADEFGYLEALKDVKKLIDELKSSKYVINAEILKARINGK